MLIVNHQISHRSTLKSFRITHLVNASPCRAPHPGDSTWPWAEQPFERAIFCHPFPAGKKPMENPGPGIGSCWIRKDGLLVGHELRPEDWEAVEDTLKVLCGWSSSWWHRQTSVPNRLDLFSWANLSFSHLSSREFLATPYITSSILVEQRWRKGLGGRTPGWPGRLPLPGMLPLLSGFTGTSSSSSDGDDEFELCASYKPGWGSNTWIAHRQHYYQHCKYIYIYVS